MIVWILVAMIIIVIIIVVMIVMIIIMVTPCKNPTTLFAFPASKVK